MRVSDGRKWPNEIIQRTKRLFTWSTSPNLHHQGEHRRYGQDSSFDRRRANLEPGRISRRSGVCRMRHTRASGIGVTPDGLALACVRYPHAGDKEWDAFVAHSEDGGLHWSDFHPLGRGDYPGMGLMGNLVSDDGGGMVMAGSGSTNKSTWNCGALNRPGSAVRRFWPQDVTWSRMPCTPTTSSPSACRRSPNFRTV